MLTVDIFSVYTSSWCRASFMEFLFLRQELLTFRLIGCGLNC